MLETFVPGVALTNILLALVTTSEDVLLFPNLWLRTMKGLSPKAIGLSLLQHLIPILILLPILVTVRARFRVLVPVRLAVLFLNPRLLLMQRITRMLTRMLHRSLRNQSRMLTPHPLKFHLTLLCLLLFMLPILIIRVRCLRLNLLLIMLL